MIGEKGADIIRGRDPLPPVLFSWEKNEHKRRARN